MTSIEGFSNYLIYENGDVYSKIQKKILKPQTMNRTSYKYLILKKDNEEKRKSMLVHRLVALAYIPNPDNKPCVDHIDQNRTNNNIDNLRWVDHSENALNIKQCRCDNKLGIKNIYLTKKRGKDYYCFEKIIGGSRHSKIFKNLEDAIKYRDNYVYS